MADTITITSPIDDSPVGEVPVMDTLAVDAAMKEVAKAAPRWAGTSLKERAALLGKLADVLRAHTDELAELLVREVGKVPSEATTEVTRSADLFDFTAAEALKLADQTIKSEDFPGTAKGRSQTVTRVPWGVVLAVTPFNYPVNLSVSKIAPALVMGNTVAFKPPTQGAVTCLRMVELWQQEADLPVDLLTVLTGHTKEIGDHLLTHEAVDAINLTGSEGLGRRAAEITGMVPLLFELGGNDPAVVLEDADLAKAADEIVHGAFKYAGQRCTAVKRVYVVDAVADQLVSLLIKQRNEHYGTSGDPREHPVGPVISDEQADYLEDLLADAKVQGGVTKCGGGRKARTWEATIVDKLPHDSRLVSEEQFGPILPVVRVKDADEAIRLANDSKYGLQASLFTKDTKRGLELAARIEAGGVHLNGPDQRGPDNFLFIGHKASGLGAQGARFALESMSQPKGIVRN